MTNEDQSEAVNNNVNHPPHYTSVLVRCGKYYRLTIECIDVIDSLDLPRHRAAAFKYIWRAGRKGGPEKELEDLKKAAWYLAREIRRLEEQDMESQNKEATK